jgi:hypothetical protein
MHQFLSREQGRGSRLIRINSTLGIACYGTAPLG